MAYSPTLGFGGGGGLNRYGTMFSAGGSGLPSGFNLSPSPRRGQGAFGSVPGAVGMPPSRYSQVRRIVGGPQAEGLISENLLRDLGGDIDYDTLQNEAARFGVATGMPMVGGGSGPSFTGVRGLNRTEQELRNIRRQGLQDYLGAASGIGALSDDPNLAANLATQNAVWASAPDPQAAAEQQMALWEKQLRALSMGGGGGRGGRGPWAGAVTAGISGGPGGGFGSSWDDFADERNRWGDYGPIMAYGNPSLGDSGSSPNESWREYLTRTFGSDNPNFGLGSGMNTEGFGPDDLTYWGDPFEPEV